MERVAESLKSKVMSAQQAAQFIKSGMVLGISGFTSVGSPKAVPLALVESGHAKDLTISVGAAVSDEVDGAMVRAGLVSRRFGHLAQSDLRKAITTGTIEVSDLDVTLWGLAGSLATLALEDVLSVLVQLQLGDLHLGGVETDLGSGAVHLLAGQTLDVDHPLLSVDFHDLALLALVGATEHLHLVTLHHGHSTDLE